MSVIDLDSSPKQPRKKKLGLASIVTLTLITSLLQAIPLADIAKAVSCTKATNSITSGTPTVTVVGTDCLIALTTTGSYTWVIPNDLDTSIGFQYLVVGGGGGGGRGYCSYTYGGGGGGGDVKSGTYNTSLTIGSSFSISVGIAGAGSNTGCPDGVAAGRGGTSSIGLIISAAGGFGAPNSTSNTLGGASGNSNTAGQPPFDNSRSCTINGCASGGGGGAGGVGGTGATNGGNSLVGMNGGPGVSSSITGSSISYGGGGAGANAYGGVLRYGRSDPRAGGTTQCVALANSGAGGSDCMSSNGGSGGTGVVYIRYTPITQVTLSTPSAPTVAATANTLKSINVSWSAISNASSYTVKLYNASSTLLSTTGLTGLTGTSTTITASNYASFADATPYKVSITAIGNGFSYLDSSESAKSDVTTTTAAALNPSFGSTTATSDGFTVSITNYSGDYTWATPTVSAGSVAVTSTVGATRVLTVTGLSPGASATITQNTTRSGYANGSATVTGTATTAAQTITRTSTSPTSPVVGATYTPTATASSGLTVVITIAAGSSSICSILTGVVTFNAVGSCVIQYNQSGDAGYAAATQVTETLTIGKATPTFSAWSGVSKTFGDSTFTVTAPTVTGSLAGSFTYSSATTSVISISGTTLTVEGGGSSIITATFTPTDTTNYNTATTTMTVTVSRATQTVTWAPATALLTTASPATPSSLATALGAATISYEVTSAGTSSCTVDSSTGVLTFTAAGSCTVRASAAQSDNYAAATKDVTFVITQATRTITITQSSNGTISPGTTSVNYGSNQTFTFTPATGYSVASITVNGAALSGSALTTAIASGYTFSNVITTHTLTATYSINTFTITLSSGANGSGSNQILTKTYGITLTLPSSVTANGYFTRTGYTVSGWTTTDGSAQTHALAGSFTTEAVTTLYPVWSSTNATLSNLTLSSGTLSPTFAAGRFIYTASVANTVATGFTVTATKGESNASVVQYLGATGSNAFTGSLSIGANIIRTIITAQDGVSTATYTLTVSRAATPPTTSVINPSAPLVTLTAFTTTFLQTNPIAAQVNTPSRVTFLVNNRAIPGCTAIKTVSSAGTHTATCKYRPTSLGSLTVSATITPNSTDYLAASTSIKVTVRPK